MKTIIKKLAVIMATIAIPAVALCTGEIRGKITENNGQPAIGAQVKVMSGDAVIAGTATDVDGKYSIKPVQAGKYDVVVSYPAYMIQRMKNVVVIDEEAAYVDLELKPVGGDSIMVEVTAKQYVPPVVDKSVYTMHTIGGDDLNKLATARGDIKGAIIAMSSDIYQDAGGDLYVRGSRATAVQYFLDGERLIGGLEVPALGIHSISVITGGIPAQYGDLTGGAVIVTTKDYFTAMGEKRRWQNDRIEAQKAEEEKLRKKEEAEKRAKEIEEEKKKAAEEKEKKAKEQQNSGDGK